MNDKLKLRNDCFNEIIKILGNECRSMKTDFLKSNLHQIVDGVFTKEQERNVFLNDIFRTLENDYGIITSQGSLTGLTKNGYDVYQMEGGFFGYLAQMEKEKNEIETARKMTIIKGWIAIATFIVSLIGSIVSLLNISLTVNTTILSVLFLIIGFVAKELLNKVLPT